MKCIADYHMHTKYSGDSKTELEDLVRQALSIGLEEIAITDHGPSHSGYGIKREHFFKLRAEIDQLKVKYPQLRIKLGLEANILRGGACIDMDDDMLAVADWVNAGYHFGSNLMKDWPWHALNGLAKFSKTIRKRVIEMNTSAVIAALKTRKVHMLTHPGAKAPVDIELIAKTAAEVGTILEINNHHGHLSVVELRQAIKYDVLFAVCSDAHTAENVGQVSSAIERVLEAGIPIERVINVRRTQ